MAKLCGCRLRVPRWTFTRDMGMMKGAKWHIPMSLSGHGNERVGIILWRRLRVWWKPAPAHDRNYVPVRKRFIRGMPCSHKTELEKLKIRLVTAETKLENVREDRFNTAQQRDRIYRAYREACKRSGEHPMTRETFL